MQYINKLEGSVLVIILIFVFACTSSYTENDLSLENINGDVVKVSEASFDAELKFGEAVPGSDSFMSLISTINFNDEGNYEKLFIHNIFGDTTLVQDYIYNEFGERDTVYEYDEQEVLINVYTYEYEENKTVETHYNRDGVLQGKTIIEEINFDEDDRGKLLKTNFYDKEGSLITTFEEYFDENGLIDNTYYETTDYIQKKSIQNNDKGFMEKIHFIFEKSGGNTSVKMLYEYEYDNEGNWIKRIEKSQDGDLYLTFRKIEYQGGQITGDLDDILLQVKKLFEEEMYELEIDILKNTIASIAATSHVYFVRPVLLEGGGGSFMGFDLHHMDSDLIEEIIIKTDKTAEYQNYRIRMHNFSDEFYNITVTDLDNSKIILKAKVLANDLEFETIN